MQILGPEVLTALTLKSTVFCVLIPCSSDTARSFAETHRLHLQSQRISHAKIRRNKHQAGPALQVYCLAYSSARKIEIMFLWNVGLSPNHTALQPKILYNVRVLDQFWIPVVHVSPLKTPFRLVIGLLQSQSHVTTITHNYFLRCYTSTQLTITYTFVTTITTILHVYTVYVHYTLIFTAL
jgi:hypothetical protein